MSLEGAVDGISGDGDNGDGAAAGGGLVIDEERVRLLHLRPDPVALGTGQRGGDRVVLVVADLDLRIDDQLQLFDRLQLAPAHVRDV